MVRCPDFQARRPARDRTGAASRVASPTAKDRRAREYARAWVPCSAWSRNSLFGAWISSKYIPFSRSFSKDVDLTSHAFSPELAPLPRLQQRRVTHSITERTETDSVA